MLAAAVDAIKGLFMQKAHQTVLGGHFFQDLHRQLVMVGSDVAGGENGRQLVLGRGHLVVFCFGEHAKLPQFVVEILHKGLDAGLDSAKVMILQFLSLGAARSVKRTPCEDEVFALVIQRLVYQKIFLFRADGG